MEAIPLVGAAVGIGSSLFGGKGSGGGSSSGSSRSISSGMAQQSSRPVDLTLPWFQQLGQTAAGSLGNFISGGPNAGNIYGGPLTADMSGREWQTLRGLQNATFDPTRLGLIQSTLAGDFLPGGPQANPFLNAAIEAAQRPTAEALNYAVGRQIPGMFAAAGQQVGQTVGGGGSTAKDLNLIRASEVGGRALGDIATNMSNANYQFERGLQQQGIQLGQQDIQAMLANLQAQGLPRTIEDQGIQRAIALGQQAQTNWLQGLQLAAGMPLQTVGNVSQGTSTQSSSSTSSQSSSQNGNLLTGLFGNQGVFGGLNSVYGQNSIFGTAPRFA